MFKFMIHHTKENSELIPACCRAKKWLIQASNIQYSRIENIKTKHYSRYKSIKKKQHIFIYDDVWYVQHQGNMMDQWPVLKKTLQYYTKGNVLAWYDLEFS